MSSGAEPSSPAPLAHKVVVVTGGAGLLGRRFCSAIARAGGTAIVADVNPAEATRVADGITAESGEAAGVRLDITDRQSVVQLISDVRREHGRIDAVVNNAYPRNKAWGNRVEEVTYQDFCENISMHLGGYFLVAQQFAIHFRTHGGGNIVNVASVYGSIAPRFSLYEGTAMTMPVEYAAIKSAVIHLSRYFAQYYKKHGVRCNSLSPGGIRDQQSPIFLERYDADAGTKGMLAAEDITGTLIYLLSDASRYVTGQDLIVDDGFAL